jgi:hemerythrin superfamily protein
MDAITLLKNDHRSVEKLFKQFERAGDRAYVAKRSIVDRIVEELSVHAAIEEQIFYPVCRETVPDVEDLTLESLEEHHVVKWLLSELDGMDPKAERFDAKVTVLIESVRHHVQEEESELFPKVRAAHGRRALGEVGDALADAKSSAPTSPHPEAPDAPPGNKVIGAVAGVVDRVSDDVSGVAQGAVTAVQDLIARLRGADRPKVSPRGSSRERSRARQVRRAAADATEGIGDTAKQAAQGAKETGKSAASGAKATTTTAKKSARATKTTAKRATTTTRNTARASVSDTAETAKRGARKTAASATTSS